MNISRVFFKLAKTPIGDAIVGLTFEKLSNYLPVKKVYENEKVIAFYHPKPFWEKHILIVPKKRISTIIEIEVDDYLYIDAVYAAAKRIIHDLNWEDLEYSLITNGGKRQDINQIHFHLCAGKELN